MVVEAGEPGLSQQTFSQVLSDVDCMVAPLEPKKPEFFPVNTNLSWVTADVGQDARFSDFIGRVPMVEALTLFGRHVPSFQGATISPNPPLSLKQFLFPAELCWKPSPSEASFTELKRYLIFDQSRDETRLILSSLHIPGHASIDPLRKPAHAYELPLEYHGIKVEKNGLHLSGLLDGSSEDHLNEEASCSHEDTEEIDALLYSDDNEDDDEVSTGHSPLDVNKEEENKKKHLEDHGEEVDSSECSPKRRKALDGGCLRTPLMGTSDVVSPLGHNADESGANFSSSDAKTDPDIGCQRPMKGKIHDMVSILQSLIPGVKGKDPLLVIDDAIKYLKQLKVETETLYPEYLRSSSCYRPVN